MTTTLIFRPLSHLSGTVSPEVVFTEAQLAVPLDIGCEGGDALRFGTGTGTGTGPGFACGVAGPLVARVVRAGGGFRLIDLGGAGTGMAAGGGLLCNGVRVTRSVDLAHGDILRFGAQGPAVALRLDPPPAQRLQPLRPAPGARPRASLAVALVRHLSQALALGLAMGLALVAGQVTGAVSTDAPGSVRVSPEPPPPAAPR